jgi:hypothetical protein
MTQLIAPGPALPQGGPLWERRPRRECIVADLRLAASLTNKCVAALVVVAVHLSVAIIIGGIVTDLGCT